MTISFRDTLDRITGAAGETARTIRGMLSRRFLDNSSSNGDRVRALGREAFDGSIEDDERGMDQFAPVGIIGRPAEDAAVEVLTAFIGGAGHHPVAVTSLDGTRRAVIDAVGLDADETLVYTSKVLVRLLADGTVEIRTIEGTAKPLAHRDEVQELADRVTDLETKFLGHVHPTAPPGPASGPQTVDLEPIQPGAPVTIDGTQVLRAE